MSSAGLDSEWRLGWRIAGASALANATGISLLFYTFNMFLLPMAADLGLSRGQTGTVQALVILAALGAPVIGRLADRLGWHAMFLACTLVMGLTELALARWANGFAALALGTGVIGFIGGGSSSVLLTRPINAHFRRHRGLALGMVGVGISLTTIVVPPWLQGVIATQGWRQGYVVLAGIAMVIGLPLVLWLMPRGASTHGSPAIAAAPGDGAWLKTRDFWLMALASVLANVATSGAISQLSPMLQDKGLTAGAAALGISAFAVGQFVGKLGGGWLLDRVEPRLVASVLTGVPALAFVLLLYGPAEAAPLYLAAALLGLLQGADVSIFAFFVAHRFDVARYGTVFGALHGLGWVGTAAGAIGFGVSYDLAHGYWFAQALSVAFLLLAAAVIPLIRLKPD